MSDEPYIRWLSRYFFAPGYDHEDMAQEARIAAWLAPHCPRLAARRRLISIIRKQREVFLEPVELADPIDVVDLVAAREQLREIARAPLSALEREAVSRVTVGLPCPKPVLHNALHRARRKLAAYA